MKDRFESRRRRVLLVLRKDVDAFLITNIKNIRYLTGFKGSYAVALLTEKQIFLFVDFRYIQQAGKEANAEIIEFKDFWIEPLKNIALENRIKKIGFEPSISYELFAKLSKIKDFKLLPAEYVVETVRASKDQEEIEHIKRAVQRAEQAFLSVKPNIKEGIAEKEIALMLEYEIRKQGSECLPFPVIVASGENSSMPHWRNSDKKLKKGDFVIIDWGAESDGYFSDMTRTFVIGEPNQRQVEIYEIVNNARKKAIEATKHGIYAKKIDAKARNLIKQSGYGDKFGHATGHGVGMDVHEFPKIGAQSEDRIVRGMVFTIEPGIYIENFGGVRIEDMVLVMKDNVEVLTTLSTDLEIL